MTILNQNLEEKFNQATAVLHQVLLPSETALLKHLSTQYCLTFQHIKILSQALVEARDWEISSLTHWFENHTPFKTRKQFWHQFTELYEQEKGQPATYPKNQARPLVKHSFEVKTVKLSSPVYKDCPTTAKDWICCGLKSIDLAENCNLGCSYCILQDFYQDQVIRIARNIPERLASIHIDPQKQYRMTTGEYSDSLMWGNEQGMLSSLCEFAKKNSNVMIELKTKSVNTSWLLENRTFVPQNLIVSWSLNTEEVITHEEAATPPLHARIEAAKKLAKQGIKIAFHFHPLISFEEAKKEYLELAKKLHQNFSQSQIVFFSLGCLNFTKSHLKTIRKNVRHSKLLKTPLVSTGDNKLTYPEDLRLKLYQNLLEGLQDWKEHIPHYLCMEPLALWKKLFPHFPHTTTKSFSQDFTRKCFHRLVF